MLQHYRKKHLLILDNGVSALVSLFATITDIMHQDSYRKERVPCRLLKEKDAGYRNIIRPYDEEESFEKVRYDKEYIKAEEKIFEGIKKLHDIGLGSLIIQSISGEVNNTSPLCIDKEYNITLPGYGNAVIEMAPMTKAVYLLFLCHEEGIIFKHLPDYRDELASLYSEMTNSNDEKSVRSTIERVTDPLNNAINEHCSRIKAAFAQKLNSMQAAIYCIEGKRGEAKRIPLPRKLVKWNQ